MSLKNRDNNNRWRNKTVGFGVSPEEDGVSGFISIIRIVVYSILVYLIIIGLTVVHIIVRIFIM